MTSPFRRGPKCGIPKRNAEESYKIRECEKQPPEVFYKESLYEKLCHIDSKVSFLIKKRLQHRCLPVQIFLRTPILKKISERLLLSVPRSD